MRALGRFGKSGLIPGALLAGLLLQPVLSSVASKPADATLILKCTVSCGTGAQPFTRFSAMLNSVSKGGDWTYDASANNKLVFNPDDPSADPSTYGFFTGKMIEWATDGTFTGTLDVGFSQPSILVGAFVNNGAAIPAGTQRLDIDDIKKFPVKSAFKPLRSEMIMHEVAELVSSLKTGKTTPSDVNTADYLVNHEQGVTSENLDLANRGHRYRWAEFYTGAPAGRDVPDPKRPGITIWEFPWYDTINAVFATGKIALRGAANIDNVAAGFDPTFFDSSYVFSPQGLSVDIVGLGNYAGEIDYIPEPAGLGLMGLGLAAVIGLRIRGRRGRV